MLYVNFALERVADSVSNTETAWNNMTFWTNWHEKALAITPAPHQRCSISEMCLSTAQKP